MPTSRLNFRLSLCAAVAAACSTLLAPPACAADREPAAVATKTEFRPEQLKFYEEKVQPILQGKCLKCHGGEEKVASEFYVTSRAALLRGGELGPAVSLEKPAESALLKAIRYEELEMPPSGKLAPEDIAVLEQWVREGLPWPAALEKEPQHRAPKKPAGVTADDRKYWAYQPVVEPRVPEVRNSAWVRTPVDAFILHKLEQRGIAPAPAAAAGTLIRRAAYDLTGLPPTPEEVQEFVAAYAADPDKAYEALLDRLLASPHYGEKWGRHWLDLVRYAETHGYERDSAKPFAWRYRDYVIDSLNRDKPYDQFVREQLAGDELENVTPESLAATGYYRLGTWDDEPADRDLAKYDILDGVVSTTGSVVLGMSVGCARCHDHKRDPIRQRDYYRLLDCFRDITDMGRENLRRIATPAEQAAYDRQVADKALQEAAWYSEIYALEQKFLQTASAHGVTASDVQGNDLTELRYRLYRDTWQTLPDFDQLKAEAEGSVAGRLISLSPASRSEAIGLVFEGKLKVPQTGEYTFTATAREGLRLILGDQRVIDRPLRGLHNITATARLEAGFAPFRVEYFNAAQAPKLALAWSGPGFENRRLSGDDAPPQRTDPDTWAYVADKPGLNWTQPDFDDAAWPRGKAGFGTRGTPGAQVGTVWKTKNIYLRRTFRMKSPPRALALSIHHDDEVTIFLNGKQVYTAAGHVQDYERVVLDEKATSLLRVGDNVLAVHCKQTGGGQYVDVRIDEAPLTLEDIVRLHGSEVFGADKAKRYVELVRKLNESRRTVIEAPGQDIMSVASRPAPPTHVLLRGLPQAEGDLVEAGVPEVLASSSLPFTASSSSSGTDQKLRKRSALAAWLADARNPLTARVLVNRLWQYHFGRGLVGTTNDFGKLGELPTHPELLDWLATDVVRGAWRLKRLHKQLMLSSVYRVSSSATPDGLRLDPANHLHWRANMRRLSAEEVRDSILAMSGALDLRVGGPSVYPPIPKEVLAGQSRPGEGWPTSTGADANRRSVYVHVKRSLQLPILAQHDQADTDSSCAVRYTTTVPTQSLGMLNGEFIHEQAEALARRLERERLDDLEGQIRRALELTTQREPSTAELQRDTEFVRVVQQQEKLSDAKALELYCLLVLNANEFFYLD